jgi:hypothetical protein
MTPAVFLLINGGKKVGGKTVGGKTVAGIFKIGLRFHQ